MYTPKPGPLRERGRPGRGVYASNVVSNLLDLFGPYTPNFLCPQGSEMAIKRKDYDGARHMLSGKLANLAGAEANPEHAEALSYALKIVINIVYGLTSAKFENAFRDNRNKDNIVAKRGALFMVDLKKRFRITVSPWSTSRLTPSRSQTQHKRSSTSSWNLVTTTATHLNTRRRTIRSALSMMLSISARPSRAKSPRTGSFGKQFQQPYVFKTLFTMEPIEFDDLCETKTVTSALYLDF